MEDACRLCLRKEESMLYIFSFKKEELCSQILNCCSVEITENDALPKLICMECIEKLQSFCEFKKKCILSDSILREHYKVEFNFVQNLSKIKIYQDIHVQTDITGVILKTEKSPLFPEANELSQENDYSACYDNDDDHIQVKDELYNSEDLNNVVSSTSGIQNSLETNDKLTLKSQSTRLETSGRRRSDRLKNKKIYICNLCNDEFESRREFIEHSKLHIVEDYNKRKNYRKFKCYLCELRFNKKFQLQSHMRLIHDVVVQEKSKDYYQCCNKRFVSRSAFEKHLRIHEGNKQFDCKFCDKTFIRLNYKNKHEKLHTTKTVFQCSMCNATFKSYPGLKYHIRIHTGGINYHCNICNKNYSTKQHLKQHNSMHTGEKRFVCKKCGSAYVHSSSLYTHNKKCKLLPKLNITFVQKKNKK